MQKSKSEKKRLTAYSFLKEMLERISLIDNLSLNMRDLVRNGSYGDIKKNSKYLSGYVNSTIKFSKYHSKVLIRKLAINSEKKKMTLAAIVHDLNNMFSVIVGYADMIELDYEYGSHERIEEWLGCIIKATSSAKQIIQSRSLDIRSLDLLASIREAISLNLFLEKNIQVFTGFPEQCVRVMGDESVLQRLFQNLIANAKYAVMEKHSYLSDQNRSLGIFVQVDGKFVRVDVVDNGIGIESSIGKKIFSPCFTTKGKNGNGVGLYACRKIMNELGGEIFFQSQPGKGTTFSLSLPMVG